MRDLIRNIYNNGKEKNGRFVSNNFEMTAKTIFEKEIKKTHYLEDKKQQLKTVRKLLNQKNETSTIKNEDENRLFKYCQKNDIDYQKIQNNTLFYGEWVSVSYVRELEIEVYVQGIFDKANEFIKQSKYISIAYLIDEQFKYHKNIFDSEYHDYLYSDEYNAIIFELLQHKIYSISKIEYEPIGSEIKRTIRKPLAWNANKTSIGTLFGLLHKNNIINGSKADIVRALNSMFGNLKESTLTNNVKLHTNENELKINYDLNTEKLTKEWVTHLISYIPKPKK